MFVRSVYSLLWCLTIVGGFIKIYSYKLVPMIIAENPELSAKEAIKLSEDMMKGYKWRAFLIVLSYRLGYIEYTYTSDFGRIFP